MTLGSAYTTSGILADGNGVENMGSKPRQSVRGLIRSGETDRLLPLSTSFHSTRTLRRSAAHSPSPSAATGAALIPQGCALMRTDG